MPARNGKIAHLPNDIREQLNHRLLEGDNGRELAAWLNALPTVQSILGSQFHGAPISEVNLTHWRQGGYLQWLTERECFDSARALADGDCDLAETGLSAERLLNILTLRYGELLLRWDFSPDEEVSETRAFSAMAKKARILQGISRSLLAIHRIQSQSPREKREPMKSSAASVARPMETTKSSPPTQPPAPQLRAVTDDTADPVCSAQRPVTRRGSADCIVRQPQSSKSFPASNLRSPVSARPDPDPREILEAV
jgi:hypothetical protein